MSERTITITTCDDCGEETTCPESLGWTQEGEEDLCAICSEPDEFAVTPGAPDRSPT